MKCLYNTWLDDIIIDGIKYVKVKEKLMSSNDTICFLLNAYCKMENDKSLETLLKRKTEKKE